MPGFFGYVDGSAISGSLDQFGIGTNSLAAHRSRGIAWSPVVPGLMALKSRARS
jgi:hypothetical protein